MVSEFDLNDPAVVDYLITWVAYHAATIDVAMSKTGLNPHVVRAKFSLDNAVSELLQAREELTPGGGEVTPRTANPVEPKG